MTDKRSGDSLGSAKMALVALDETSLKRVFNQLGWNRGKEIIVPMH